MKLPLEDEALVSVIEDAWQIFAQRGWDKEVSSTMTSLFLQINSMRMLGETICREIKCLNNAVCELTTALENRK
jgi:hypothetical protein